MSKIENAAQFEITHILKYCECDTGLFLLLPILIIDVLLYDTVIVNTTERSFTLDSGV